MQLLTMVFPESITAEHKDSIMSWSWTCAESH